MECPRTHASQQEKPPQGEACAPRLGTSPCVLQLEKSLHSHEDTVQPKVNLKNLKKKEINNKTKLYSFAFCLYFKEWAFVKENPTKPSGLQLIFYSKHAL